MKCPNCNREFRNEVVLNGHLAMGICGGSTRPSEPLYRPQETVKGEEPSGTPTQVPTVVSVPTEDNGSTNVFNPEGDPDFIIKYDIARELDVAEKISARHPVNLLITGHPGCGKTSLGLNFAVKYHRPCVAVDFGVLQEPQQLFQTTYLQRSETGSYTDTRESGLVKGMETERCVVILDELNRPENERVLNPLLPFLDGRQSAWIDDLRRRVTVAPGVVFIATLNEGAMFCGVTSLDAALRDRFRELYLGYLTPQEEAKVLMAKTGVARHIAFILADFAAKVRDNDTISRKISTRQLLTAAENHAYGDELWRAVSVSTGQENDPAWRQQIMEIFSLSLTDQNEMQLWTTAKRNRDKYETLI